MELRGRVALVTGAGSKSGIGRSVALLLAERGAAGVVVNYSRNAEAAAEVVEEIEALGVSALAFQADVSVESQVVAMVGATVERFGRLDVLVNNAARTTRVSFEDLDGLTDKIWDETFDVNLRGAFYAIRASAPHLRAARGAVVNVASIGGIRAVGSSSVAYAASKAALMNMTMTLARGLAPEVRVNAIVPGFIDGQWLQEGLGDRYEQTKEKVSRRIPVGMVTSPDGAAEAVAFLLENDYVTGHNLVIDGGYTIRD